MRAAHLLRHVLGGLLLILLAIAGVISIVEDIPYGDAVYFTLITGLTVGYGDISPVTAVGRLVSIVAAFIGLMLTGIYVAIATYAVSQSVKLVKSRRSHDHKAGADTDPTGSAPSERPTER